MKKSLGGVLALLLALSAPTAVFAAGTTVNQNFENSEANTTVNFTVDPSYTVTIPEKVELKKDTSTTPVMYTQDADITCSENTRLAYGDCIMVSIESDFTLTSTERATLSYTVQAGTTEDSIKSGAAVAAFKTSTDEQKQTLHFSAADPEYAGEYSDTVTFTIEVKEAD